MPSLAHRSQRDIVRVEGPDAGQFLQGQLSQDVAGLAPGAAAWSLLLQPAGKVVAWLRVQRAGPEAFALDVDAGWGAAVEARLRTFLLRTKATITVEPGVPWLAVRGEPFDVEGALPPPGPGVVGADLIGTHAEHAAAPAGAVVVGDAGWQAWRIRAGIPALGAELTEATIPAEAGPWLVAASVSFAKGCYTGQELVARIDARGGHVPRPIRVLEAEGPVTAGDVVRDGEGDVVGSVTSAAPAPDGAVALIPGRAVALAPLRRSVGVGARVLIRTSVGDVAAAVVEPAAT
ncbi:MAG: folate-binding protein YgfZ [Actinobacteria bacterium]|nr:folate-binding protein YgfZ [Actinomycetota bacterium]